MANPALINIPKSYVEGAELDIVAQPVSALTLSGGLTYVKSRVQEDPGAPFAAVDPFGKVTSFIGEAFPNTPAWMGNADAVYTVPVPGDRDVYFGATVSARSGPQAAFGEAPEFRLPGYASLDLRAGVKSQDEKWRAELWTRNVTNRAYWQNVYNSDDVIARAPGEPLTDGIALSYRFQ
ncbi:MAG TPA: TonB-dependent receptor [Steroidobacteraceae bacterium]|nr:TonB-dependent receptor [Steroidobacteraceae bacterium]